MWGKGRCLHWRPREWEACSLGSHSLRCPHAGWKLRQWWDFSCTWCQEHWAVLRSVTPSLRLGFAICPQEAPSGHKPSFSAPTPDEQQVLFQRCILRCADYEDRGPVAGRGKGPGSSRLSPRVIKSHPEADTKGIVLSWSQPLAPRPRTIGEENLGHLSCSQCGSDGSWENAEYFSAKISHLLNLYIKGALKPPLF